ncbi:MAG TPA: alpha/beta hydrolase [Propionibacteriaceae bacterium]|nr:alpha/beta hydrolase [Propionibacteriaceae bacterium]
MRQAEDLAVGHHVPVRGRKLWMDRSGDGKPAVVFVPGAGSVGLDFLLVHEQVAQFTTSVLYDRAGTGWSDDTHLPRSADEVTDELRALLRGVEIPAPYLLVGHSLGGVYVQRFAQRFPREVAGLLLLDPAHEDWDLYQPEYLRLASNRSAEMQLPEVSDELLGQIRASFDSMLASFPAPIRRQLIDKRLSPERLFTGFQEGGKLLDDLDDLRNGGARPDVPLIVLSGTDVDSAQMMFQPEEWIREQIRGSERLFDAIAAAAPRGQHRSLPDASHATIPMARPDAVATAVKELLAQVH